MPPQKSEVRPLPEQNEAKLFLVQMVRCHCGRVLATVQGVATCTSCRRIHTVTVTTTQGVRPKGEK